MCVYLGSLVRTVIALHNLIDNKLALQKSEKEREDSESDKKKNAAAEKEGTPVTTAKTEEKPNKK